ncbi:hypothetical protein [Paraburkholderia sacchari]|uniref:hypothetical protein n=1 Tax=Paraburkholderia sacchari TaxID=159450 RepID=UPI000541E530|nr:hypothetical protein [Paraburkholderia sacchari]NLP62696.1 hypothetical protein [Paraburkholderia sacchari]
MNTPTDDRRGHCIDFTVPDTPVFNFAPELGYFEVLGTMEQLIDEALIPRELEWPTGFNHRLWNDEKFEWRLCRQRPEGARGPRRFYAEFDYWSVRSTVRGRPMSVVRALWTRREAERIAAILQWTREDEAQVHAVARAHRDGAFQQFKQLVPALNGLARKGRRRA